MTLMVALLKGKCPRCRKGNMFTYPATNLTRFNRMNDVCPHCGARLEPEPGYYQGAMYVGYGITLLCMAITSSILYLTGSPSDLTYITVNIGVMVLLIPWNYRYSRIL